MIPDWGSECQSPWAVFRLRKCTGQEDSAVLFARPPLAYQENDVLSALQGRRNPAKVILGIYRLLVYFKNNVSAGQADVVGERRGLDVLHDHALACGNVETISHFRTDAANRNAQLALFRRFLRAALVVFAEAGGK